MDFDHVLIYSDFLPLIFYASMAIRDKLDMIETSSILANIFLISVERFEVKKNA